MDQLHAEKAREAGEALPQPDIPATPPQKPPLSKKCFMTLVLLILIGITGGIGYVMKRKKEAQAEREFLATSTTARPTTTTPPLSDLSDDEILKKCGHKFKAVLGKSDISVFKGWNGIPEAQKSAFWLEGDLEQDKASIKKAKVLACLEEIPTFVINMRPTGLRLMHDQNDLTYFDKQPVHQDWEEYDNHLKKLVADIKAIPSIVILEPKLLQLTYDVNNQQYDYENGMFRDAFIERAQKVTNALQKSWVYIDAGDSNYLHEDDHLEHIAKSLLRVKNIRGFAMNSAFFANLTFVELQARRIACRTDLYYITDTSRSGGEFSNQEIEKIAACRYDPPNVKSSNKPMWGFSASQAARASTGKTARRRRATQTLSYDQFRPAEPEPRGWSRGYAGEFGGARLRMSNTLGGAPSMGPAIKEEVPMKPRGQIRSQSYAKSFGGVGAGGGAGGGGVSKRGNDPLSDTAAAGKMQAIELKNKRRRCLSKNSKMTKSDGFVWLRPNGESDGRLAKRGEWLLCLKKHTITCDDTCPLLSGQPCGCDGKAAQYGGYGGAPGAPYGGQPAGFPAGYPMSGYQPGYPPPGHMPVPYSSYQQPGPNYFQG